MKFFGWELSKKVSTNVNKDAKQKQNQTFAPPRDDEGSVTNVVSTGGRFSQTIDLGGNSAVSDKDLLIQYRQAAMLADVDNAINDIVDGSIVIEEKGLPVELNLEETELSDSIKEKIQDEFNKVLRLFRFREKGYDYFRNWYVDGRLFFHIIPHENLKKGIKELRSLDPLNIKKCREYKTEQVTVGEHTFEKKVLVKEYYVYSEVHNGFKLDNSAGVKIDPEAIIQVDSGIVCPDTNRILSYINKALKPINNLRMLEDSLVVYRISRAPERRIFYIDVGNLPKGKAETYVQNMMHRYRNKLVYDSNTGEIQDSPKHMAMLEDFWLPRMEGGRGTEISTLPGGENLGQIEDVIYFQRKLYKSLNVPISRLETENGFSLGRSSEITRDELKFQKFISRLRGKFSKMFIQAIKSQIILKGIIDKAEWNDIEQYVHIDFAEDNYFSELKEHEIMRERFEMLSAVDEYVGKFLSRKEVRTKILRQSEEDIKRLDKEMEEEKKEFGDDSDLDGAEWG